MSEIVQLSDSLQNLVAGLGTDRDKSSFTSYATPMIDDMQLVNAYRGSWAARKGVDIPAMDACRKWRDWQASKEQIALIEAEEARLNLRARTLEAMIKARLFGGAAIVIGTGDKRTDLPLNPDTIKQGGIKYITVITRRYLVATEIEFDPLSEYYGKPKAYRMPGGAMDIHPSRLVIFHGNEIPDIDLGQGLNYGWGDSVLTSAMPAVKHYDESVANVVSLLYEAKIDVISIPNLMAQVQDKRYEADLLKRLRLATLAKGNNGTLILDANETYTSKSPQLNGLTAIISSMEQSTAGAFDIPASRMFGQNATGLNSNGDENTRNYHDNIQSLQELRMRPAMALFDECLIRSALGSRPPEVAYTWAVLWQPTTLEKSTVDKNAADTIVALKNSGLFNPDALSEAAVNMLNELSILPGLDVAIEKYGDVNFELEAEIAAQAANPPGQPAPPAAPSSAPAKGAKP